VAIVTLLPVLIAGAYTLPHQIMWQLSRPVSLLFVGVQLLGLAGLAVTLLQTDALRFAGLGQFVRYLRGQADINLSPDLIASSLSENPVSNRKDVVN
jgi:hypothetical protein